MSAFELPISEIHVSYARSSGPGGQNVNKVNSKTVLYWNVLQSQALREDQKKRIIENLETRINREGDLILMSDRYRDQGKNRDDCLEKLLELVKPFLYPPKKRKVTKPSRSSVNRGKDAKKRNAEKKSFRKRISD